MHSSSVITTTKLKLTKPIDSKLSLLVAWSVIIQLFFNVFGVSKWFQINFGFNFEFSKFAASFLTFLKLWIFRQPQFWLCDVHKRNRGSPPTMNFCSNFWGSQVCMQPQFLPFLKPWILIFLKLWIFRQPQFWLCDVHNRNL